MFRPRKARDFEHILVKLIIAVSLGNSRSQASLLGHHVTLLKLDSQENAAVELGGSNSYKIVYIGTFCDSE